MFRNKIEKLIYELLKESLIISCALNCLGILSHFLSKEFVYRLCYSRVKDTNVLQTFTCTNIGNPISYDSLRNIPCYKRQYPADF